MIAAKPTSDLVVVEGELGGWLHTWELQEERAVLLVNRRCTLTHTHLERYSSHERLALRSFKLTYVWNLEHAKAMQEGELVRVSKRQEEGGVLVLGWHTRVLL